MNAVEWAEAYQRTGAVCKWDEWDALCQAQGVPEEDASALVTEGRWITSEAGQEFLACPESSDGYRWVQLETTVESCGFRGAAHGGFSTDWVATEMAPRLIDGKIVLVCR